jgi:hypothetical protein
MTVLAVAMVYRLELFKVDVQGAYINTPRPDEVKYKYVSLAKHIASVVVSLAPEFAQYLDSNGTMIVELDYMWYGQKEAGFYWIIYHMSHLIAGGFESNVVDPCVVYRQSAAGIVHGAITVDDGLYATSSAAAKAEVIAMYAAKFGVNGYTVLFEGDKLNHLGMTIGVEMTAVPRVVWYLSVRTDRDCRSCHGSPKSLSRACWGGPF